MTIYKEFVLLGESQCKGLVSFLQQNARSCWTDGKPLRIIVTGSEKKRNAEQNARLWKAVYEPIADQAWVGGKQYSKDVWHEFYADKYGFKAEFALPDGRIISRRKSTTEMTIAEFAEYMMKVEADAAMNLGVEFN